MTSRFSYKSLSYRLLGRIFFCEEDYRRAESALRTAVELSPDYPEGNYDYAQYSVLAGSKVDWRPFLRRAISARPHYWYMAKVERNFASVRRQVDGLLAEMHKEADQAALSAIADAEWTLSEAKEAMSQLPPEHQANLRSSLQQAHELLASAKMAQASGDYRQLLKAAPEAARAKSVSSPVKTQGIAKAAELQRDRDQRYKEACRGIPAAVGHALLIGVACWLVFGMAGCILDMRREQTWKDVEHAYQTVGVAGFFLGVLGRALYAVWEFRRKVQGK